MSTVSYPTQQPTTEQCNRPTYKETDWQLRPLPLHWWGNVYEEFKTNEVLNKSLVRTSVGESASALSASSAHSYRPPHPLSTLTWCTATWDSYIKINQSINVWHPLPIVCAHIMKHCWNQHATWSTPPIPVTFRCRESIDCKKKNPQNLIPAKMTHDQPLSIFLHADTDRPGRLLFELFRDLLT